ncbi:EcsC family protein [Anaerosinus sp.]|uniref:EcsC family protein n=1 Tax=Selenobaculum sp. TaxID=3074374 RepID=UPI0015AE68B9
MYRPIMSEYEETQYCLIQQWKSAEPGIIAKALDKVTAPASWVLEKIIPLQGIKYVLDSANSIAKKTTDVEKLKNTAAVAEIKYLRHKGLAISDFLAHDIEKWALGIAATEGAATGWAGFTGLVIDVPAVITLALRTIYKIGLCYGYEGIEVWEQDFVFGILSAAGANTIEEKMAALTMMNEINIVLEEESNRLMGEFAKKQLNRRYAVMTVEKLAKQLGMNMARRKLMQALPVISSGVGAAINVWYINEVVAAAKCSYQERWLIDNQKVMR